MRKILKNSDIFGAISSTLCLFHCVVTPFLFFVPFWWSGLNFAFNDNEIVFTLSFHGKKNYPFKKEKSDLDIDLEDKTNDNTYIEILEEVLPKLLKTVKPDFIFYLSGVDILKSDPTHLCKHQGSQVRQK